MYFNNYHFKTINSTSTYASENAEKIKTPAIIIADEQTEGRGRKGKLFYSPADSGLYFSILIKTRNITEIITPSAAVAVCKAIEDLSDLKPQIKWVNDVFLNGKKVCGILSETFIRGDEQYLSIGIGINLTTEVFPENLSIAGSIGDIDKNKLVDKISSFIGAYIEYPCRFDIVSEYDKRLFIKGMDISYFINNDSFNAEVIGINEKCNLIVRNSDGKETVLTSGEISIKLN